MGASFMFFIVTVFLIWIIVVLISPHLFTFNLTIITEGIIGSAITLSHGFDHLKSRTGVEVGPQEGGSGGWCWREG